MANMMSFRLMGADRMSKQSKFAGRLVAALLILSLIVQQATCWRVANEEDDEDSSDSSDNSEEASRQREDKAAAAQYKRSHKSPSRQQLDFDRTGWRSLVGPLRRAPHQLGPGDKSTSPSERGRSPASVGDAAPSTSPPLRPPKPQSSAMNASSKTTTRKSGKLIEWDDDDGDSSLSADTDLIALHPFRQNLLDDSRSGAHPKTSSSLALEGALEKGAGVKAHQPSTTNGLIYHGQLRGNNTRVQIAHGIELEINTNKPVGINRRSHGRAASVRFVQAADEQLSPITGKSGLLNDQNIYTTPSPTDRPPKQKHQRQTRLTPADVVASPTDKPTDRDAWNAPIGQPGQDTSSSSSDWRPIVVSARMRRSGKTHRRASAPLEQATASRLGGQDEAPTRLEKLALDYKWRPINSGSEGGMLDLKKDRAPNSSGSLILTDSRHSASSFAKYKSSKGRIRKFEQPFDKEEDSNEEESEDFAATRIGKSRASELRDGAELEQTDTEPEANRNKENKTPIPPKWKPLDLSTVSDLMVGSTTTVESANRETTTIAPTTPGLVSTTTASPLAPSNGSETAQRSASDLNYIYSMQPQQQASAVQASGSSYYSNYQVQQPQSVEQPQSVGPIIDATSGQTPEMIADRTPDVAPVQQQQQQQHQDFYSMPQSVAAFQPAPAPPSRAPASYFSNYAYDAGGYGVPTASVFRSQAPAVTQQARQLAPSQAPVIRQEHHYHYYNQQQPQVAPDRSQQLPQQQQQPSQQQQQFLQPTVIRELQPIMISQPVIQQQAPSSTTPAPVQPQIIREIVREVPMQPQAIQMPTRVVMQQPPVQINIPPAPIIPPPPPPPQLPPLPAIVRDTSFETSYTAPAKRLMRQITNSMPQVAIRMPTQFRVQVPAIQLPPSQPLRVGAQNLAPVTRQTGSFIIPPMPKKTTTLLTETQAMPTHTTIMQTTQFTPATRTTVYTTDHQVDSRAASSYK